MIIINIIMEEIYALISSILQESVRPNRILFKSTRNYQSQYSSINIIFAILSFY